MKYLWILVSKVIVLKALVLYTACCFGEQTDVLEIYREMASKTPYLRPIETREYKDAEAIALGCDEFGYFIYQIKKGSRDRVDMPAPSFDCQLQFGVRRYGKWKLISKEQVENPYKDYRLKISGSNKKRLFWGKLTVVKGERSQEIPAIFNSNGEILVVLGKEPVGLSMFNSTPVAYNESSFWKLRLSEPVVKENFRGLNRLNPERREKLVTASWGAHLVVVKRGCQPVIGRYPKKVFQYSEALRWITLFLNPLTYSIDHVTLDGKRALRMAEVFPLEFGPEAFRSFHETLYSHRPFLDSAKRLAKKKVFHGCNVAWRDIQAVIQKNRRIYLLFRDGGSLLQISEEGKVREIELNPPPGGRGAEEVEVVAGEFFEGKFYILSYIGQGSSSKLLVQRGEIRENRYWNRDDDFSWEVSGGSFPEASLRTAYGSLFAVAGPDLSDEVRVFELNEGRGERKPVFRFQNFEQPIRMYDAELFPIQKFLNYSFKHGSL